MSKEAMKLALEALEEVTGWVWTGPMRVMDEVDDAITALRQALEQPAPATPPHEQQELVRLRRGNILRCIETDELCTVWSTSTTGKTLVKWNANEFGDYTAEQIGELFWLEPEPDDLELAAEKSDNYAAFHAGYRFAVAHSLAEQTAQQQEMDRLHRQNEVLLREKSKAVAEAKEWFDKCQSLALAQQQEPVAEITAEDMGRPFNAIRIGTHFYKEVPPVGTKLYTSPPQRTWVGLTDEERREIGHPYFSSVNMSDVAYARAIEAKLKEKNT